MEPEQSPICPRCASPSTRRLRREGFLQVSVLPLLSIYPWECTSCRIPFHRSTRGKLKRKHSAEGEAHLPPIA